MTLAGSSGGSWSTDLSHIPKTKNNTSDGPYKLSQMYEGGSSRETPFLFSEFRARPGHQATSSACQRILTQPGDLLLNKSEILATILQITLWSKVKTSLILHYDFTKWGYRTLNLFAHVHILFAGKEHQGGIISRGREIRDPVHVSDPEKKPHD